MMHLSNLYFFQKLGVVWLEEQNGRGIIGDDMGLGKTVQAIAYLKRHPELRPALIICPATIKLNWKREIYTWNEENSTLIEGRKAKPLISNPFYIINWDILASETTIHDEKHRPKKILLESSWIFKLPELGIKAIIGDEIQAISSMKAIRTKAFHTLVKSKEMEKTKIILLSGTPIKNRPSEFFSSLNITAPLSFPNHYKYLHRYCGPYFNGFGWTFNGASNIEELNEKIKPFMLRREKSEVLTDLPPKNRIIIELETDKLLLENYKKASEEFLLWLKDHVSSGAEAQTNLDRLKQLAYIAKRNSGIKWIQDYINSGNKLVIGAYHTNAIHDIYESFKKESVIIDGSITGPKRQEAVDEFQNNEKIKLIICQILTVPGLTLTAAAATAAIEFAWSAADHIQFEDRVHRISQEADSVFAYYLVAPETIEMKLAEMIQKKYKIVSEILDGKKNNELFDGNLLQGLLKDYKAKFSNKGVIS